MNRKILLLVLKCLHGSGLFQKPCRTLRSSGSALFSVPTMRTRTHSETSFQNRGPHLWKNLGFLHLWRFVFLDLCTLEKTNDKKTKTPGLQPTGSCFFPRDLRSCRPSSRMGLCIQESGATGVWAEQTENKPKKTCLCVRTQPFLDKTQRFWRFCCNLWKKRRQTFKVFYTDKDINENKKNLSQKVDAETTSMNRRSLCFIVKAPFSYKTFGEKLQKMFLVVRQNVLIKCRRLNSIWNF